MGKRVRITNSSVNCYKTRVLTGGGDLCQYERNPVLLYMHERGDVIGYIKDIRRDGDEISGEPVFDEATELSRRCKKQWDFGSLRMVSMGIDILETSEDPSLMLPGQLRPTITKWRLDEVSIVDIGANDDAIVLRKDGQRIELGKDGECQLLPLINNQLKPDEMELKTIALLLDLPATADEAAISAEIERLKTAKAENEALKRENETLHLERITDAVDTAIKDKRLQKEKREQFVELGKKVGAAELQNIFAAMPPRMKLSGMVGHQGGAPTGQGAACKLSDLSGAELLELRRDNPGEYKRLYRAEYGMDCDMED